MLFSATEHDGPPHSSTPGRVSPRHSPIPEHRLVIVEDHDPTRTALKGIFGRMGWDVGEATTVAAALACLERRPEPCCMILDLDLPDGPGERVLAALRAGRLNTRVVVSSGTFDPVRIKSVMEMGPDAFLPKPITLAGVWEGICRVCEPARD